MPKTAQKNSKTAMIRARTTAARKKAAEEVFEKIGINATTAINMFYVQVAFNNGLPFDVVYEPNEETKKALQNIDDEKDLIQCKDAEDLFQQLGI